MNIRGDGEPSAEAGNPAGEDDGAGRDHHPEVPAVHLPISKLDPAKQAVADEVLARAGTGVPGEVEVGAAEAIALIEAGIADAAGIEMLAPKPTVPEVLDRFRSYVAQPGNGVGGSLHIVIEDRNLEDDHVRFCIEYAESNNDREGAELARLLLRMSRTQRGKIARRCWYREDGSLIA